MKDVQFMSAKEKEVVLKQWITFVKNGFQLKQFSDRIYQHLIMHCSFIAHYNRNGFYQTYFEQPEDTAKFLKQFDKDFACISVEYGGSWWVNNEEYNDINTAMSKAIEPYKQVIYERCNKDEKQRDIACASALLRKHKIKILEVTQ